jgi:polar amino acid transport system substrate-binding protein
MNGTLGIPLALLLAALPTVVGAQDPGSTLDRKISVATRQVPPFAMKVDGEWDGITIELLRKIGEETGLRLDLKKMALPQMLEAVVKDERVSRTVSGLACNSVELTIMKGWRHPG